MPKKNVPPASPKVAAAGPVGPRRAWLCVILAAAAFLLYANTIPNGYVLDDVAVITNNSIVTRGPAAIPEIFRTPYLHGFINNPNDLYRPLSLTMFAIEYALGDGAPMLSHVVNVFLFCGCVILLFLALDELLGRQKSALALLSALLFALHPVHTEVVANIKSRDELLCFFFAMASLLFLLRYARGGRLFLLAAGTGLYFLSLLSKETSISFLLLVPLILFLFEKEHAQRNVMIIAGIAGATATFLVIRYAVLHAYDANHPFRVAITENALAAAQGFGPRLSTALLILGRYAKLLLVPYPLVCDYSYNSIPLVSFNNVWVWASLLLYVAAAFTGIRRLMQNRRDVYGLGILFCLGTLVIFSNIAFLVGATMAERFLFFPSAGFCLIAAALITDRTGVTTNVRALLRNRKVMLIIVPLAAVWSVITVSRNADWKDAPTLYRHDMEWAGDNYRLPYYLGSALINQSNEEGDSSQRAELLREAIGYLKKSIAVYARYPIPHAQVGISYTNLGQYDSAERYDLQALALNARDTFTRNNLAAVYFKKGRYREAIAQCRINLGIYPAYARAYSNIGVCYMKLGVPDSAIRALRSASALEPDARNTYYYLSAAFGMAGMPDSVKKYQGLAGQ